MVSGEVLKYHLEGTLYLKDASAKDDWRGIGITRTIDGN